MKTQHTHGQGLVEYALILALVAVAVIVVLQVFGPTLQETYCQITGAVMEQETDIDCKALFRDKQPGNGNGNNGNGNGNGGGNGGGSGGNSNGNGGGKK